MRLGYNIGTTVHCCRCDWKEEFETFKEADQGMRDHLWHEHKRSMVCLEEQKTIKGEDIPRCVWTGPLWRAFGDKDPYYKGFTG